MLPWQTKQIFNIVFFLLKCRGFYFYSHLLSLFFGLLINISSTAFSVILLPKFVPTLIPTLCLLISNTFFIIGNSALSIIVCDFKIFSADRLLFYRSVTYLTFINRRSYTPVYTLFHLS